MTEQKMRVTVRVPATMEMARDLAPRLRKSDVAEVRAATGGKASEALLDAMDKAAMASALLIDGRCQAIAGVVPIEGTNTGTVWMLASEDAFVGRLRFIQTNRGFIEEALAVRPYLFNYVDVRNIKAIRWLQWLKFKFDRPQYYGTQGLPFQRFWIGDPGALVSPATTRQEPGQMGEKSMELDHV